MKIALILSLALIPILSFAQDKPVFKAGSATSNITPPLGMEIVGNFAPRPVATHINDDLHVRCLVLDDGTNKLVFAIADNLHISREIWDEIRTKLEADTGIPGKNIMLAATHTHSSVSPLSSDNPAMNYRSLLISRVIDGVKRAINNLEPARVAWGTGNLPDWLGNRRWILKEGVTNPNPFGGKDRAVMNPSKTLIPDFEGPAGPINPDVYCLSVQALDGRQIALMANYWLHYVGGVPREHISADYFGEFCKLIEQKLGSPCVGILANGPCGDINSNDYTHKNPARIPGGNGKPYEKIKKVASDLAKEVLRVHSTLQYQDWVSLDAAATDLQLGVRRPTPEMVEWAKTTLAKPEGTPPAHRLERPYAERVISMNKSKETHINAYLQTFRIGELGITASPFEVFTETGLEIKSRSPFKDTFSLMLANGANGYLPTPKQLDLGGYETWLGTNRVEREASVKITTKLLELLEQTKKSEN